MNVNLGSLGGTVLVAVFALLAFSAGAAGGEEAPYLVKEGEVCLVLSGFPQDLRYECVRFTLIRTGEVGDPLYFSLSDLVDEQNNAFPGELIAIETAYDSGFQRPVSQNDQILLLAENDEYAEVEIGVFYTEAVGAGTYQGFLRSAQGSDLPLKFVVHRYTEISVRPDKVLLDILGPGKYEAEQLVEITLRANHAQWTVDLNCPGLFHENDLSHGRQLNGRPPAASLQLQIIREGEQVPRSAVQVVGGEYGWGAVLSFRVQTEVDWKHRAGTYVGVIQIDVSVGE